MVCTLFGSMEFLGRTPHGLVRVVAVGVVCVSVVEVTTELVGRQPSCGGEDFLGWLFLGKSHRGRIQGGMKFHW